MPDADLTHEDATLLFDAVREAGHLAITMLRQQLRRWVKSDGSPVTEADIAVDALLASRLRARRPSYGWLSEESQDDAYRTDRARCWIVDPIDGTRSFSQGGSDWCVAVALVEAGRPTLTCLYRPVIEEFFAAATGQGAWLNGDRLKVAPGRSLKDARLLGTRKSLTPLLEHGIAPDMSGRLPLQLRLAEVAAGRAKGAVSVGLKNDWDLAAGDLLVHEAGGRAGDLQGAAFVFNRRQTWQHGLIAASAGRQSAIVRILETP